jgi:hypothetical protein
MSAGLARELFDALLAALVDGVPKARGPVGIGTSRAFVHIGYPPRYLPDRMHLLHSGLVPSHLRLRALCQTREQNRIDANRPATHLQLLHPVLIIGRPGFCCLLALAVVSVSIIEKELPSRAYGSGFNSRCGSLGVNSRAKQKDNRIQAKQSNATRQPVEIKTEEVDNFSEEGAW